jgi:hypothetical protein
VRTALPIARSKATTERLANPLCHPIFSAFDLPGTCFMFCESLVGLELRDEISRIWDWAWVPHVGVRGDGALAQ